jgi:hypothetical protein
MNGASLKLRQFHRSTGTKFDEESRLAPSSVRD